MEVFKNREEVVQMAKLDIQQVANEIRGLVIREKAEGATQKEIREYMVRSIDHTALTAFEKVGHIIEESPEAGFAFTYSIYESLGGVNLVMIEEGLDPIHISEPDFVGRVMVKTIEEFTGQGIDEVFTQLDAYKKEQGGAE